MEEYVFLVICSGLFPFFIIVVETTLVLGLLSPSLITPVLIPLTIVQQENQDKLLEVAVAKAKEAGFVKDGDIVVLTAGMPLGVSGRTNMIRVVEVGKDL